MGEGNKESGLIIVCCFLGISNWKIKIVICTTQLIVCTHNI